MSDQVTLNATVRTEKGKGPTGRLRRSGRVPAVLYGYQVDPTALSVDALELFHAMHTSAGTNVLIRLEIEGETNLVVLRDIDRHPTRDAIVHLDFLAVNKDVQINVEVRVVLTGEDDVEEAGVVNLVLNTLPMLAKPLNIPDSVELSVAGMDIGDVRRAGEIELPDGTELDIDPERTVVTINAPDIVEEPETDEDAELAEGEEPVEGEAPADASEAASAEDEA